MTEWYHGSGRPHEVLRRQKAIAPPGRPAGEALGAIYLTPSFAFALACGARPPGLTEIDLEAWTVRFSDPATFDPEQPIFVHVVYAQSVPAGAVKQVGKWQIAVLLDEVVPVRIE